MTRPGWYVKGVILAGALAITPALSPSLAARDRPRIWLGLGLGSAARADGAAGTAVMAEVVYQLRAHHFAIRAFGAADSFGSNANEFGEIGVLYGRAALRLASIAGVGIQGFANLNPKSVYGGVMLFLQLGWLPG